MQTFNSTNGVAATVAKRALQTASVRYPAVLLLAISLTGCGTVYDPKPWTPDEAKGPVVYTNMSQAGNGLGGLAFKYRDKAGDSARETLATDIPLIGLAFAAPINAAFHGAKDVTIGLGFGSTAFSLGRSYFNPHLKVGAYNDAGTALSCASSVAYAASGIASTQSAWLRGGERYNTLTADLSQANELLGTSSSPISDSQRQSLKSASDSGNKLLGDLSSMDLTIAGAPQDLSDFANNTIVATNTKILTGSQDTDAVLKLVPQTGSSSTPPASNAAPAPGAMAEMAMIQQAQPETKSPAALIDELQQLSTDGSAVVQSFNGKWGNLKTCVLAKTSN